MLGLCLMAGIVVYMNVFQPTMSSSVTPALARNAPSMNNLVTATPSQQAHDEEGMRWIDKPDRDPFAPVLVAKPMTERPEPSSTPSTKSRPTTQVAREHTPPTLILKAVALEATQRSAVINRQVVYEGEMIEGYQVVSIQLKGVWLERHGKKEFLTFTTNTTS